MLPPAPSSACARWRNDGARPGTQSACLLCGLASDPCVDDSGPGGARLHTRVQWRTELEVAVSRLCCSGICLFCSGRGSRRRLSRVLYSLLTSCGRCVPVARHTLARDACPSWQVCRTVLSPSDLASSDVRHLAACDRRPTAPRTRNLADPRPQSHNGGCGRVPELDRSLPVPPAGPITFYLPRSTQL